MHGRDINISSRWRCQNVPYSITDMFVMDHKESYKLLFLHLSSPSPYHSKPCTQHYGFESRHPFFNLSLPPWLCLPTKMYCSHPCLPCHHSSSSGLPSFVFLPTLCVSPSFIVLLISFVSFSFSPSPFCYLFFVFLSSPYFLFLGKVLFVIYFYD